MKYLALIILVIAFTACGTATPAAQLATVTRLAATSESAFDSGGLGLTRSEWERSHRPGGTSQPGYTVYDQGKYAVIFVDGQVQHLERSFSDNGPSLTKARAEGATLIPQDARLVKTYSPDGLPELTVDLYLSQSLKDRFTSAEWPGGDPGNFTVIYGVYSGKVARIVISLGNNP